MQNYSDVSQQLTRIETRMMRGFDALGIDVKNTGNWLTIDNGVVTITSTHNTLYALEKALIARGVEIGSGLNRVVFQGRTICYI